MPIFDTPRLSKSKKGFAVEATLIGALLFLVLAASFLPNIGDAIKGLTELPTVGSGTPFPSISIPSELLTSIPLITINPTTLPTIIANLTLPPLPTDLTPQPIDVMLVMDVSGSMKERWVQDDQGRTKMEVAKAVMTGFADGMTAINASFAQIGLVTFSSTAKLDQPLSTNASQISQSVQGLTTGNFTSIGSGLDLAQKTLTQSSRSGAKRIIVLATDGEQNTDPSIFDNTILADTKAANIIVLTVGITDASKAFTKKKWTCPTSKTQVTNGADYLQCLADETGGYFLFAPTPKELEQIYQQIIPNLLLNPQVTPPVVPTP
jgi:uncharacterized protein YegL